MNNALLSTGLPSETIERIQQTFNNYKDIEKVCIYGSRAKGNYRDGSDIDLCIMDDSLNNTQLVRIESELDDLLLPYKIDLSLFHVIKNKELSNHIERVGIVFYSRN